MSEEKTQTDPQQTKTTSEEQPTWTMPFPQMMRKMMARCGCRPVQMSAGWTTCFGMSSEKKDNQKAA